MSTIPKDEIMSSVHFMSKEQFIEWFFNHSPYWATPDMVYDKLYEDFKTLCRTNEIFRDENKRYKDEYNDYANQLSLTSNDLVKATNQLSQLQQRISELEKEIIRLSQSASNPDPAQDPNQ